MKETETVAPDLVTRTSFQTTPEQLEAIERLAAKHERSVSGEIRMALAAWIERCAKEGRAA